MTQGMSRFYTIGDLRRCLLIAALVGTILVAINLGPGIFLEPRGDLVTAIRTALNYVVPFSVASVSALLANRARAKVESL